MRVHRGQFFLGLLFLVISGLIVVGLVRFGTILGYFLFFPWILSKVSGVVINPHLANIVALIVATIVYLGLYKYLYRHNKTWGYAGLIILMVLQSGFMFLSESNRFFSLDGKALRYYTTNPLTGEFQMFDREVYDAFGQKSQPVDYRMATEIYRQQNKDKFPNKEVPFEAIRNFFSVVTGQALVYYCQDDQNYHFFMHRGYDSQSGRELLPVTPDVVERARRTLEENAVTGKVD